jgi:hypothetical protein
LFNLPDLLQPTQDRLNAKATAVSNVFFFMVCFLSKILTSLATLPGRANYKMTPKK